MIDQVLQIVIAIWDIAVMTIVFVHLFKDKPTWTHKMVRLCVFLVVAQMGVNAANICFNWYQDEVKEALSQWLLGHIGMGILFLYDVYKPQVYQGESNVANTDQK